MQKEVRVLTGGSSYGARLPSSRLLVSSTSQYHADSRSLYLIVVGTLEGVARRGSDTCTALEGPTLADLSSCFQSLPVSTHLLISAFPSSSPANYVFCNHTASILSLSAGFRDTQQSTAALMILARHIHPSKRKKRISAGLFHYPLHNGCGSLPGSWIPFLCYNL